ncbi:MAG: hypothetical protein LBD40_03500 [Puniceicoccales bacterium]|nr:hypothetical protein [Puniceicoccales bacterium]
MMKVVKDVLEVMYGVVGFGAMARQLSVSPIADPCASRGARSPSLRSKGAIARNGTSKLWW